MTVWVTCSDSVSAPGSTTATKVQSLPPVAIMPWGVEEL